MTATQKRDRPTRVWVLATPKDPGLPHLQGLAGADVTIGETAGDFAGAEPADVVFVCGPFRDALTQIVNGLPELTWVHVRWAGIEHAVDPGLGRPGLRVTNGRGVFSPSLAEFTLAALFYFLKDFRRLVRQQQEGRWAQFSPEMLAGRSLGIVGYGDIGRAVARLTKPLGVRIRAVRRDPAASAGDPLVDEVLPVERLADLCAVSDDLVVATPLTPQTRGLVGAREIGQLRPTSILVNVGRGASVDETALLEALRERRIRGAALDVFETEPLPAGHPFYALDNVLLSPHCADQVPSFIPEAMAQFRRNLERFQAGEPLQSFVDPARGY
jgi:phosphoglycerate dehydrogenase-like enzyme